MVEPSEHRLRNCPLGYATERDCFGAWYLRVQPNGGYDSCGRYGYSFCDLHADGWDGLFGDDGNGKYHRHSCSSDHRCWKSDDGVCVGEAYRVYGLFFQSAAVTEYVYFYQEHGFLDKSVTWDTRYEASILYFRKAAVIAQETDHYDVVSNIDYHIGRDFEYMHDTASACAEFDQSSNAHEEFQRKNPRATVRLVEGHGSFGDTIAEIKRKIGCPGSS